MAVYNFTLSNTGSTGTGTGGYKAIAFTNADWLVGAYWTLKVDAGTQGPLTLGTGQLQGATYNSGYSFNNNSMFLHLNPLQV